jgi:hypothetical protein
MQGECEARPFKRLYALSLQKRDDSANEDHWCVSLDGRICAVSDGASVSFDSGPWALILARRFIEDPVVSREWIQSAIAEYGTAHDREAMAWMLQAAFDRGSFATLLGIAFSPDWRSVRVFAIGDTILAFIDGGRVVRTIPYVRPEEFDQSPQLLSTSPFENRSFDDEAILNASTELNIASHETPILLIMTDALGRWLLDQPDSVLSLTNNQLFGEFVERERGEGRLRRNDTTLVVLGVTP